MAEGVFAKRTVSFLRGLRERLGRLKPRRSIFVEKHWCVFLGIILLFALLTRLYGLAGPQEYYFDEIYHSFTAREYLHENPDAWVWYSKPPEGRAYDWVQPPAAKLLMAASMWVIGEKPVGWRLPGVLLGVGAVLFVYLIGVALFKNRTVSLLAAALFALDGLPLVLSRIGTNDSVFLFFTLGTIYFFIKERYFVSSVFFGFAASTKLSAIWIPVVCFMLFFVLERKWTPKLVWFVIIPPVMYMLSYVPFFTTGHDLAQFYELQKQMIYYHSNLEATHPFSSKAWTWPLMLKPIWFFTQSQNGMISNIYAQGNPVVFWAGFVAVLFMLVVAVFSGQRNLWIVLIAYFGFFAGWSLSPRVMFLYHYLPSVPFLCLALSWSVMSNKHWKKASILLLILALLVFVLICPRLIGIPVADSFNALYYKWLPG